MKKTAFILLFVALLINFAKSFAYSNGEWDNKNNREHIPVVHFGTGDYAGQIYMNSNQQIKLDLFVLEFIDLIEYEVDGVGGSFQQPGRYVVLDNLPDKSGLYELEISMDVTNVAGQQFTVTDTYDLYVVPEPSDVYTQDGTANRLVGWRNTINKQKPVLIVEGFDPANQNFPPFYYQRGKHVIEPMVDQGHSVFVLNLGDGGADMEDNSQVVQSAIKELYDMTNDELRLFGMSMGGVLARHALVSMEDEGTPHNVSHFISLDAPQQGAVIDNELLEITEEEQPGIEQFNSMADRF